MERKIFLNVLVLSLIAVAIAVFVPGSQQPIPEQRQSLPWQIEATDTGSIKVFNLTLGESRIADAIARFKELAEVSLFVSPHGKQSVEVYFNQISLAGLRAKLVITADISDSDIKKMFLRGERISTLGDGSRKVTLSDNDLELTKQSPIAVLTYLPKASLDEELLHSRFGEPARRIREKKNPVTHWLYPEVGLDIALNHETNKAVLQYLAPKNFQIIIEPLISQGTELFN